MSPSAIGVVHLVRSSNGPDPLRKFLDSYQKHPAGIDHELIMICKGFGNKGLPPDVAGLLADVPHQRFFVADRGLDIGPYLEVARQLNYPWLCFMNSFAEILADDWLEMLSLQVNKPGVGLVGATGTWESLVSDFEVTCRQNESKLPHKLVMRMVTGRRLQNMFPPFPNPHLRTNALLIARERFVRSWDKPIKSKRDAHCFESGKVGLSAGLSAQGLQLLVVGKDGVGYSPEDWPCSHTFRSGNQENLMVADNQTRNYLASSPDGKAELSMLTWGRRTSE